MTVVPFPERTGNESTVSMLARSLEHRPSFHAARAVVQAGEIVREARQAAGLSIEELAKRAKCGRLHLMALEDGTVKRAPTVEKLAVLLHMCGKRLVLSFK